MPRFNRLDLQLRGWHVFLFVFSTQLLVIAARLGSVSRTSVSLEMSALRLTRFLPVACWDWLAAYRDPRQNKLYKKLMDGNHNSEILVFSIQTSKGRKMEKKKREAVKDLRVKTEGFQAQTRSFTSYSVGAGANILLDMSCFNHCIHSFSFFLSFPKHTQLLSAPHNLKITRV